MKSAGRHNSLEEYSGLLYIEICYKRLKNGSTIANSSSAGVRGGDIILWANKRAATVFYRLRRYVNSKSAVPNVPVNLVGLCEIYFILISQIIIKCTLRSTGDLINCLLNLIANPENGNIERYTKKTDGIKQRKKYKGFYGIW